jgi:predicted regulator of Ras-like GTPase activity (Roadblock/LC7/MglB family)
MKTRRMVKGLLLGAVLFWVMLPWVGHTVPTTINYQGYLTDTEGTPINTTVPIVFSLYTGTSGGSALWTETQNVIVAGGVYSVNLGSSVAIPLPFDVQYYLGVKVGTDAEMTPRFSLTSVGYAFRAQVAEAVAGSATFSSPIISTVTTGTAPLQISSTTNVANLNTDMLDGQHAAAFALASHSHDSSAITSGVLPIERGGTGSGTQSFVDVSSSQTVNGIKTFSSPIASTVGTGTTPLQIASITLVSNLNAEMVGGKKIADFDARYSQLALVQNPRSNTLTTVDSGAGGDVGKYNSVTMGTDGLPVISYLDSTNYDLKVAKCGNAACSSGNTLSTVDSGGDVGFSTSITVGTDGLPVISYCDATNGHLKVAKCGNAACSSGNTIAMVDSGGTVGEFTSITIGTDGLPLISYSDAMNGDLRVAKCGNASCSSGNTLSTVDSGGAVGRFTSITIGTDSLPVISYYDVTNGHLKVAKCGNASCSSGNTLSTVDSGVFVGFYTSITIGTDGLPVISYNDVSNGDLKVAKCGNVACSSGNTLSTVDSGGTVGDLTSITIGTDGLPVISYCNEMNGDLKVAKCANGACSAANTITTVVFGGTSYSSITIGTDGLPVISYYEYTSKDLKVAKCANPFCLNNWSRR